jgi:hypothetical protein
MVSVVKPLDTMLRAFPALTAWITAPCRPGLANARKAFACLAELFRGETVSHG